jgi:hypothetical protein
LNNISAIKANGKKKEISRKNLEEFEKYGIIGYLGK